ncbi:MAG: 23S rRNA (adenine(2503)-C(2))-methyltransferase RlmN [Candidatus Margulisbacteria bacterium]|nr:23S rRNA (adenine(2503)-C(2))-methyltransferase RlmN [Candidatus Margulisiibacteriota bacterium]
MNNILDKSLSELQADFASRSWPAFRAKQIFTWLHKKVTFDFAQMTDLPKELRDELPKHYKLYAPTVTKVLRSRDGTKKFLFTLNDGKRVEAVLLKDNTNRKTVCLSTQAGCKLKCAFCATGGAGFQRDLTPAEIISQVYRIAEGGPDISNIVYMGMGEPFLNYDNVLKSLRLLTAKEGGNFGQRKITISTCGIPDGIMMFADEELQVRLAISLNAATDAVRSRLMPINRIYPLAALREALLYYLQKTGRRVTLEYVMLDGVNDRQPDLKELRKFCEGLDVHVNLIPFNPFGKHFRPSKLQAIHHFLNGLAAAKINAVMRQSKGQDIMAACGQLAGKPL